MLHIINFNNVDKIRFGRGHETDVRIHDISVSRLHAYIHRDEQGRLFIEDNSSKFGTLVELQAPLHLNENLEYSFQAGRTVLHLSMQQEQSIFNFMKAQQISQQVVLKNEKGEIIY